MVIRKNERSEETIVKMRGGNGQVLKTELLPEEKFCGHGRLFAHFSLEPGSSIGKHVHEGESETYFILRGTATMNDNGTDISVSAGDVVYTANGQSHSIENTGSETLEFIGMIVYA